MDLVRSLAELEQTPELHAARLLVLLGTFAGNDGSGRIHGLTKLAKLDFLLRYPVMLERALQAKGRSTASVQIESYERTSVESRMVRYRFGPWDDRYRMFLNILIGKGLATVTIEGRTISIGLTPSGIQAFHSISSNTVFQDLARRAATIRTHFDMTATNLMRFIYGHFPEVLTLRMNEAISY